MGRHYIEEEKDDRNRSTYTIMVNYDEEDESGERPDEVVAIITGRTREEAEEMCAGMEKCYYEDKQQEWEKFEQMLEERDKPNWIERLFGVKR